MRCNLEYQQVLDWVNKNAPENLEIVNTGQDLKWLAKNELFLFLQQAEVASIWFKIVQNEGQKWFFQRNNLDMILVGRRTKDGIDPGKKAWMLMNMEWFAMLPSITGFMKMSWHTLIFYCKTGICSSCSSLAFQIYNQPNKYTIYYIRKTF